MKKDKKRLEKKLTKILVVVIVLLVLIIIIGSIISKVTNDYKYNQIMNYVSEGRYDDAMALYKNFNGEGYDFDLMFNKIPATYFVSVVPEVDSYSGTTNIENMETITFGSYLQSNITTTEPIEWIILDRNETTGEALLLSKYILDCKCYNDDYENVTWENCSLRYWLNNNFYNKVFSSTEKQKILIKNIKNDDNNQYNTKSGNDTNDKIFCLSIDEVEQYFKSNTQRMTKGTNYAKTVDNYRYNLYVYGSNSCFWLRSPGNDQNTASVVATDGSVNTDGLCVDNRDDGVRPALWIKYK